MSDSIHSAHPDPDAVEHHRPANAEDRKAAAALSSLNTNEIGADSGTKSPPSADQEALGKAMSRLEIAAGQGPAKKTATAQTKEAEVVKKKAVKIASEDVNLLVDALDLNRVKATELLKSHGGDSKQAIKAFITPAFGA
ncbi:hypothetical protein BDV25DRAFT_159224 [Aspergillus avenaceus]|uniref:Nascent polypeptide-associated complex subunit alpha-like UBA domain-containing protein n=1 Tax=Aspergillus avenaceus TaxID=36643 RepID=A0A5N6TNL1_ASPAV|nr:hypothetical protein BDV25DRAFT_159224 [Aspergillus avenaceus]